MFSHEAPTLKCLIVFTDYNLFLEGVEQVEICFIAHHEWMALQYNEHVWCK